MFVVVMYVVFYFFFFFSSRRRHTRWNCDWSSDVCSSDLRFTDLMVDQRRTSFFMVLIPERMAILDTERALEMFDALGLQMAGLIVNQVYPAELADAKGGEAVEFLRNRARMQRK